MIELTISGTSPTPFSYNEIYVVAGYGGGDQPFTHPNDDQWVGGSWGNYEKIGKPPLRSGGRVTAGQTAHGVVFYSLQSEGDLYIKLCDPDTGGTYEEAGWKVRT